MKAAGIGLAALATLLAAAGGYVALNMGDSHADDGSAPPRTVPAVRDEPRVDPVIDMPDERSAGAAEDVVSGNNAFALDMFAQLGQAENGNLFFSPYSIESVLALVGEGAGGSTASEILATAHLPAAAETRRSQLQALHAGLNQPSAEYQLSTANALWVQAAYPLKRTYIDAAQQFYSGGATNLDFARDSEGARKTINSWIEDRTQDKIKDLFGPGSLTPLTRFVVTNTIYFRGKWEYQFDPGSTRDAPFHVSPEQDVTARFMALKGYKKPLRYAKNDRWQAVALPYKGEDLSLLAILPGESKTLGELEAMLNSAELTNMVQALAVQDVVVQLPKFKFDTKYMLNDSLQALGMHQAFGGGADFSGMADTNELYIDQVIHQAFVAVDEAGTEAAAATGVAAAGSAAPPAIKPAYFIADRPFLFAIRDDRNGALLFVGRVADPTR